MPHIFMQISSHDGGAEKEITDLSGGKMFDPHEAVLLTVSGGVDSIVMLTFYFMNAY
jgi:hypothetical protein